MRGITVEGGGGQRGHNCNPFQIAGGRFHLKASSQRLGAAKTESRNEKERNSVIFTRHLLQRWGGGREPVGGAGGAGRKEGEGAVSLSQQLIT